MRHPLFKIIMARLRLEPQTPYSASQEIKHQTIGYSTFQELLSYVLKMLNCKVSYCHSVFSVHNSANVIQFVNKREHVKQERLKVSLPSFQVIVTCFTCPSLGSMCGSICASFRGCWDEFLQQILEQHKH